MPSWMQAVIILAAIGVGAGIIWHSYQSWLRKQRPAAPETLLAPLDAAMPAPRQRPQRDSREAVTQVWHRPATPGNIPSKQEMQEWEQELWDHLGVKRDEVGTVEEGRDE